MPITFIYDDYKSNRNRDFVNVSSICHWRKRVCSFYTPNLTKTTESFVTQYKFETVRLDGTGETQTQNFNIKKKKKKKHLKIEQL